jgi:hypothetical protein
MPPTGLDRILMEDAMLGDFTNGEIAGDQSLVIPSGRMSVRRLHS